MRDELDPGTAWHTKMDGWTIFPMKHDGATRAKNLYGALTSSAQRPALTEVVLPSLR